MRHPKARHPECQVHHYKVRHLKIRHLKVRHCKVRYLEHQIRHPERSEGSPDCGTVKKDTRKLCGYDQIAKYLIQPWKDLNQSIC
ncbi:MAG: hypothetical protein WC627_13125 [Legionella sp.]